jgi:hypothetical protein
MPTRLTLLPSSRPFPPRHSTSRALPPPPRLATWKSRPALAPSVSTLLLRVCHKPAELRRDLRAFALGALDLGLFPLRDGHGELEWLSALLAQELVPPAWSTLRPKLCRDPLLSQLTRKADEPPAVWWGRGPPSFDTPANRRLTRERILQHVQPAAKLFPRTEFLRQTLEGSLSPRPHRGPAVAPLRRSPSQARWRSQPSSASLPLVFATQLGYYLSLPSVRRFHRISLGV